MNKDHSLKTLSSGSFPVVNIEQNGNLVILRQGKDSQCFPLQELKKYAENLRAYVDKVELGEVADPYQLNAWTFELLTVVYRINGEPLVSGMNVARITEGFTNIWWNIDLLSQLECITSG